METNQDDSQFRESLAEFMGQHVVLDTPGQIVYLGRLVDADDNGIWLEEADVHDCSEGHAGKEYYVVESAHHGIRANRRRVFVMRSFVTSISAIEDVVVEISDDRELWAPSE